VVEKRLELRWTMSLTEPATAKFKLSGNACDSSYRPKDGDAGFLEPGTPIYQIIGHPPSQLLAARQGGRILAYEARTQTA
jgi:hypothetical protein